MRTAATREREQQEELVVDMQDNVVTLTNPVDGQSDVFSFDTCAWTHDGYRTDESGRYVRSSDDSSYVDQHGMYERLGAPMLEEAFAGQNTTLLTHGAAGTGKAFSVFGSKDNAGILPLTAVELFNRIESDEEDTQFTVTLSMSEIHQGNVHDLLLGKRSDLRKASLKVRSVPEYGVVVTGLTDIEVRSRQELLSRLRQGETNASALKAGSQATRPHMLTTICLSQRNPDTGLNKVSKLLFVVLGSTSSAQGLAGSGLKEVQSINSSLHALNEVLKALADNSSAHRKRHVPFRNSTLTRCLEDALGGSGRLHFLGTISPAADAYADSLKTLRLAYAVSVIRNRPIINAFADEAMTTVGHLSPIGMSVQQKAAYAASHPTPLGRKQKPISLAAQASMRQHRERLNAAGKGNSKMSAVGTPPAHNPRQMLAQRQRQNRQSSVLGVPKSERRDTRAQRRPAHVSNSPSPTKVNPRERAATYTASGDGLSTGHPAAMSSFDIISSEPHAGHPDDIKVTVTCESAATGQLDVPTVVHLDTDGAATCSYVPPIDGHYSIHVLVNGSALPGCPFTFDIAAGAGASSPGGRRLSGNVMSSSMNGAESPNASGGSFGSPPIRSAFAPSPFVQNRGYNPYTTQMGAAHSHLVGSPAASPPAAQSTTSTGSATPMTTTTTSTTVPSPAAAGASPMRGNASPMRGSASPMRAMHLSASADSFAPASPAAAVQLSAAPTSRAEPVSGQLRHSITSSSPAVGLPTRTSIGSTQGIARVVRPTTSAAASLQGVPQIRQAWAPQAAMGTLGGAPLIGAGGLAFGGLAAAQHMLGRGHPGHHGHHHHHHHRHGHHGHHRHHGHHHGHHHHHHE